MNIEDAFPGNYIKASDLKGRDAQLTIAAVEFETVGGESKPVVYFRGKDRGWVLNKTNARTISEIHTAETENWISKPITIYPTRTDYQGKMVDAIRVRYPNDTPPQQNQQTRQNSGFQAESENPAPISDEIQF